jgi:hypothetical protein
VPSENTELSPRGPLERIVRAIAAGSKAVQDDR